MKPGDLRRSVIAIVLGAMLACAPTAWAEPLTPARSLSSRGPLAISFAQGAHSDHWSIETGWPLGRSSSIDRAGGTSSSLTRLDARMLATTDRRLAGTSALSYALVLDHAAGPGAGWLGLSVGGPDAPAGPRSRYRLATGLTRAFAAVQGDVAVVSSAVLFHNDPRWSRTIHWRRDNLPDSLGRDTSITVPSDHSAWWTTTQASLRWQRGRMGFETIAGLSLGEGVNARRWAQGTARLQLSRHVLALVSAGERPIPSMAFESASHAHTMIGLQFAPWSTREWALARAMQPALMGWSTAFAGRGLTLVRIHCRETQRVEVAGDFTDWQPVDLTPLHAGWWGRVIPVEPGLHRVQVRLDGGPWLVPPGLPHADDGPAGPAGSLLVR